ncbi:glycoside hydrolase family 13 protein [Paucibacter sediminis]|uniref:Glycoside hydrolase family 13 protein n=1 Tax=Paucibacter sediminis TaxID=3019553 RepID=A0AA95NAK3_9BURK|nr:glycoside hydrolase family 13 protein [Paucibacter sp. S2-9]WIT10525.1 glycoside hydrolase family 13 protein [Paucibacter sp. S2-9]
MILRIKRLAALAAACLLPGLGAQAAGNAEQIVQSLRFDSRALQHKKPFGAVTAGSEVRFTLQALPGVEQATLVVAQRRLEGNQDLIEYRELARLPMQKKTRRHGGLEQWSVPYRFGAPAIYGYHFELRIGGRPYVYQNNADPVHWTKEAGSMGLGLAEALPAELQQLRRYRQTVYAADFKVPDWARDTVYYYIFPERFRNGDRRNDPQPGRDRYQDKDVELHANWLDKPFKPGTGDGSDAVYNNDFFGGDLAGIIEKLDYIRSLGANAIYMTPIFRAASNHKYDTADYTQVDPAFGTNADFARLCAEAAKRGIRVIPDTSLNHVGSDSIYFDRFGNFKSGGAFESAKINPASPYAGWFSFDASQAEPDRQFKGWVGVLDLPEINKASPAFRAFAYGNPDSVMKQWLDRGAAGWRMDVAPWVPDDFWRAWRTAIKAHKPDAITIAETWFDASKFFLGDSFDSTMNYIFRNALLDYAAGGDARKLAAQLELMREAYPPQAFYALMNLISSHDQARALHHFGYLDDGDQAKLKDAKQRLRLAMFFQMMYPGAPAIYYGDEVGVAGGDDPYNRATYPWADQGGRPDEALLAEVQRLTAMRHALPVLRHGSLGAPLYLDEHVIVLLRQDGRHWAITATNNAATPQTITLQLPPALAGATFGDALSQEPIQARQGRLQLTVPALFGRVLTWN